jgi:tyrosyl-tRNA synthetase
MPLLEGLDGVNKMSKSLNNYVGIEDAPADMFGKLMSTSDDLMWRYIELLSFKSLQEIDKWKSEVLGGRNPRDIKVMFAKEMVARFHSAEAAETAVADFESRFRHGGVPDQMPEFSLSADGLGLSVVQALKLSGLSPSTSEAMRGIKQGGVRIDGEKISDKGTTISRGKSVVLQFGKRKFAKIQIN